jgi:hypothetical protein
MCGASRFTTANTVSAKAIAGAVSALRFLFGLTLDRPDFSRKLVRAPCPRKLPDVLER